LFLLLTKRGDLFRNKFSEFAQLKITYAVHVMFEALFHSLAANPYFSAGFGLVGVGTGLALLRYGLLRGWALVKRRAVVTVEVSIQDPAYWWLMRWLGLHTPRIRSLSLHTRLVRTDGSTHTPVLRPQFTFAPAVGSHFIRYRTTWFLVERKRERGVGAVADDTFAGHTPWETLTLTTLSRNRNELVALLEEAQNFVLREEAGKTIVYTPVGPEWRPFGYPRHRRPLNTVILASGVRERIVLDVREFQQRAAWYLERGIPYRRGYLLHGPPGTGKSSLVFALAGELGYSICLLSLSDRSLTDDRLLHLLSTAPENAIILMEDVDAVFVSKTATNEFEAIRWAGHQEVTYSGVLNALDGIAASEGRLLFMTTNYLERLPAAMIRPGRVDVIEYIGLATSAQVQEMFVRFYPQAPASLVEEFVRRVPPDTVSPAALQGYFLMHKDTPDTALRDLDTFVQTLSMSTPTPSVHPPSAAPPPPPPRLP
jgi:chaperone BCS1